MKAHILVHRWLSPGEGTRELSEICNPIHEALPSWPHHLPKLHLLQPSHWRLWFNIRILSGIGGRHKRSVYSDWTWCLHYGRLGSIKNSTLSECFHGNGSTKHLLPPPVSDYISLFPFAARFLKKVLYLFFFIYSHYLLGFCPLAPLKLFMAMTCTLLKIILGLQSSFYTTSQQHLLQLTTASSLIHFLHLVSGISHTPTPLVVLSHLLWLSTSLFPSS